MRSTLQPLFFLLCSLFLLCYGYRGAIILTMAGSNAPEYLSWSCQTIGSSSQLFDMLIFHENNPFIEKMNCPNNVYKINLGPDGIATLITKALLRDVDKNNLKIMKLNEYIPRVLRKFPYFLAEFKTGTGDIFHNYLTKYTHWTYTDPDIFWGNLSQTILTSELEIYDVISFALNNDGNRLFLRGQFSLHKNRHDLNQQWKSLPQFELNTLLERMQNIITRLEYLHKKKLDDNQDMLKQIKSYYFISAEGAYSSLIFNTYHNHQENLYYNPNNKNNYKVLIAGRMMSDKITKPVVWKDGIMYRCSCKTVDQCLHQYPFMPFNQSQKTCLYEQKRAEATELIPLMHLRSLSTEISGDCRMGWILPQYRLCGSSFARKRYNEVVLDEGKWYFNDERSSHRRELFSGAFFHFRMWEDSFANQIHTIQPSSSSSSFSLSSYSSCLITYLSLPDRNMYVHPCDLSVVQNIPILTVQDFIKSKRSIGKESS